MEHQACLRMRGSVYTTYVRKKEREVDWLFRGTV